MGFDVCKYRKDGSATKISATLSKTVPVHTPYISPGIRFTFQPISEWLHKKDVLCTGCQFHLTFSPFIFLLFHLYQVKANFIAVEKQESSFIRWMCVSQNHREDNTHKYSNLLVL